MVMRRLNFENCVDAQTCSQDQSDVKQKPSGKNHSSGAQLEAHDVVINAGEAKVRVGLDFIEALCAPVNRRLGQVHEDWQQDKPKDPKQQDT